LEVFMKKLSDAEKVKEMENYIAAVVRLWKPRAL
jgi:hypothetical protein